MAEQSPSTKSRARVACIRCNSRKTRCIIEGQGPCQACRAGNHTCVPINSLRGKYRRNSASERPTKRRRQTANEGIRLTTRPSITPAERSAQGGQAERTELLEENYDIPRDNADGDAGSLYADVARHGVHSGQKIITATDSVVFLGEAFSLTYVMNDVLAPFLSDTSRFQSRLHHPLRRKREEPRQQRSRQKEFLVSHSCYFLPDDVYLNQLLDTYFDWFHPAFPIVERDVIKQGAEGGTASLFLVNSILLVAVTICDRSLVQASTNTTDRYEARKVYYRQSKLLYDNDLEVDQTDLVAGIFLMSFWWDKPNDPKDSWHWLGVTTSLAQSLGMHRSTKRSNVDQAVSRRWRKIWWSIRVRGSLVSGSIGRPQHIAESDCDVELLTMADFDTPITSAQILYAAYACQMARLAQIMTDIISSRYSATSDLMSGTTETSRLVSELHAFRAQLPDNLIYRGFTSDTASCLWQAMVVMAYNYAMLLLCRPSRRLDVSTQDCGWGNSEEAVRAANEVSRTMEDILSASVARYCQIFTIPAMFNALAMHLFTMCTSATVGRELAENRVRTCMLGLQVLQDSWPVGSWVYRLFLHVIRQLKSKIDGRTLEKSRPVTRAPTPSRIEHLEDTTQDQPEYPHNQLDADVDLATTASVAPDVNMYSTADMTGTSPFFLFDELFGLPMDQNGFFGSLDIPDWDETTFDTSLFQRI